MFLERFKLSYPWKNLRGLDFPPPFNLYALFSKDVSKFSFFFFAKLC